MKTLSFGLLLTTISWFIAWSKLGILSEYSFLPLWVGYITTVNGISESIFSESLAIRMGKSFIWLFVISVPFWWFFEFVNSVVKNWHYIFPREISYLHYFIEASINFSVVVPAVLSTTFLVRKLMFDRGKFILPISFNISHRLLAIMTILGGLALILIDIAPNIAFPLVWIAPILILESLETAAGYKSLLSRIALGEWELPISIGLATMITGLFWEMWNYYSLPKWIYTIPYVEFWKIFEMPFLGYFGYPFFGIIVYSCATFALSEILDRKSAEELLEFK